MRTDICRWQFIEVLNSRLLAYIKIIKIPKRCLNFNTFVCYYFSRINEISKNKTTAKMSVYTIQYWYINNPIMQGEKWAELQTVPSLTYFICSNALWVIILPSLEKETCTCVFVCLIIEMQYYIGVFKTQPLSFPSDPRLLS